MRLILQLVLLCVITLPILGQAFDQDAYDRLIGDWEGSMKYMDYCPSYDTKSCSFQLTFLSDHSFSMTLGAGCYNNSQFCKSSGQINSVTSDTISASYYCVAEDFNRPCYCSGEGSLVEFCWKYNKRQVMKLELAINLSPAYTFSTCPTAMEVSCSLNNSVIDLIGIASVDCAEGQCVICDNANTCNNRGKCNGEGECNCFASFSGAHCEQQACPNQCNRHGICDISKTAIINKMAIYDHDKHKGVCRCFSGWVGEDCSSQDIYGGKRKLWEGIIFVGVVSTVTTLVMLLKKISFSSFRRRRLRRSRHRTWRNRTEVEVEMEEFINPL